MVDVKIKSNGKRRLFVNVMPITVLYSITTATLFNILVRDDTRQKYTQTYNGYAQQRQGSLTRKRDGKSVVSPSNCIVIVIFIQQQILCFTHPNIIGNGSVSMATLCLIGCHGICGSLFP